MFNNIIAAILLVSISLTSCNNNKKMPQVVSLTEASSEKNISSDQIPHVVAKRYFVNNDYKDGDLQQPYITSETELRKYFGMATVMGKDGKPTPIDFTKQQAIAVIGVETDYETSYEVVSLAQKNNQLALDIKKIVKTNKILGMRPLLILIIDKKINLPVVVNNVE